MNAVTEELYEKNMDILNRDISALRAENARLREAVRNLQVTFHILHHKNGKSFEGCPDCIAASAALDAK